jgi:hypothetical protein
MRLHARRNSLIQKLILPLGYPTLSLSVILSRFCSVAAALALWPRSDLRARACEITAAACALGVVVLSLLITAAFDPISNFLLPLPLALALRSGVAVAAVRSVFVLGTPFPSGPATSGREWPGRSAHLGAQRNRFSCRLHRRGGRRENLRFNGTIMIGAAIYAFAALLSMGARENEMKAVVQRVKSARVEVDGEITGEIGVGLVVFVGVTSVDEEANAQKMAQKLANLRIFSDEAGKFNFSVQDVQGCDSARFQFHFVRRRAQGKSS